MPFKSEKQQRYFHYLKSQNKLPKSINLDEYDKSTNYQQIPVVAPPKSQATPNSTYFKKTRKLMGKF